MNPLLRLLLPGLLACSSCAWAASPAMELVGHARLRTQRVEWYDGSYRQLAYPMGDVANDRGVCTDLVIRAYRGLGIDLQVRVHEDMARNFASYPRQWRLSRPDANIDHRRVPNLQVFLARAGASQPITSDARAYAPGDLVTWMLPGNVPHIGIVSDRFVTTSRRPKVIHNIGRGPVEDDSLFRFPITGHYRFLPAEK